MNRQAEILYILKSLGYKLLEWTDPTTGNWCFMSPKIIQFGHDLNYLWYDISNDEFCYGNMRNTVLIDCDPSITDIEALICLYLH